jgi:tetratricopeptide (TPR) repeat protein
MKPGFHFVPSGPSYYMQELVFSVKKMKKPILIFIMAMILASVAGVTMFAHAQEDDPALVAENMLNALNSSSAEVHAQFDVYAMNNTVPDDAAETLSQADAIYVEAQAAFDSGDYNSTIDLATEALSEYGNALALLTPVVDDGDEEENEVEDTYQKLGGYDKALERLDKLYHLASDLDAQGVNVSEAVALLNESEAVLNDLGAAIDQGDLENLEAMLDQANSLMGQATGMLQRNSGEKRVEKTERFIIQTRLHVSQLETKLNRILAKYNLTAGDDEAIRLQFQALKASLDGIDAGHDDLKNITRQLQHIVKESHQVGKGEHEVDDHLVDQVNDVSEKETKLNRYRERLGELAQLGYNTSEIEVLLNQAETLLNSSMNSIDEGDNETAGNLIDQADALLDQVDDQLDDMEKTMKHESKDESDDFDKKVAELRRKISRYHTEIQSMARRGVLTTALETQLDEIEQSLNAAQTSDDLDSVEQQLDSFGNQLNADTSGIEVEDETHSGNDKGKSGKGDDEESEDPEEPETPEEPESTG